MKTQTQFLSIHTNTEDGVQSYVTINSKGYFVGMIDLDTNEVLPMGMIYPRDKFSFEMVNEKALKAVS